MPHCYQFLVEHMGFEPMYSERLKSLQLEQ
jgi:hypothetical protein